MTDTRSGSGLPTIFGFFLGLMVTAFIGVGVYTFYPPPDEPFNQRITAINRETADIQRGKPPEQLTPEERTRLKVLSDEENALQDQQTAANRAWGRFSSILLVAFATLTMALSIVGSGQLPVISNGLLLGGVFTMVYGVGWIVQTDSSGWRFGVITVALAITLALGYVRFVRRGREAAAVTATASADTHVGDLEDRVRRLEERLDDAARAMRPRDRQ